MSLLKNDPNPSMFEEAEPKKKKNRRMISRSPKVRTPTPTYVDPSRTTPDPRASPFSPRGAGASKKSSPNRDLFSPSDQTKKSGSSGPTKLSGAQANSVSKPSFSREPKKNFSLELGSEETESESWLNQNKANVDILRKGIRAGISKIQIKDLEDKTEILAWLRRVLVQQKLSEKIRMVERMFLSKTTVDWLRDMWPKVRKEIQKNIRNRQKRGKIIGNSNRLILEHSLMSFFNTKIDERFPHAKRSGKSGNGMSRSRTVDERQSGTLTGNGMSRSRTI